MRTTIATLSCLAVFSGTLALESQTAEAGGYYYRARSFYVTPPIYANLPVFGQPPIVVYEAVPTYPAPVAGYYGPLAAPVAAPVVAPAPAITPVVGYSTGYAPPAPVATFTSPTYVAPVAGPVVGTRVSERQVSTPFYNRYRYRVHNAFGPDYTYRVRQTPGSVRFTERWSH